MNEYYSFGTTEDINFNDRSIQESVEQLIESINRCNETNIKLRKNHTNLLSIVSIVYNDEPETVYHHSPQQYTVEFVCFICGVISMWTGFSIFSLYTFGRRALIQSKKSLKIKTLVKSL